ncbi:MAG: hypothetical protein GWP08_14355 [Nitrospiraceae bacterium]|nr:hypothetical protein [Nitrospiraceae bacterium]
MAVILSCAAAFGQISVTPIIVDQLTIHPGGLKTISVVVGSTSKDTQVCTVSVHGMEVMEEGLPVAVDDAPRSCRDWISVNPSSFILAPGQGKRVVCQIRVPPKTMGGYYAILSISATGQRKEEANRGARLKAGIYFSYRNLVPVLLVVPGSRMQAIIQGGMPTLVKSERGSGYTIEFPLRNSGNTHARVTGQARILSESGQLVEEFEVTSGRGLLLPEHQRLFKSKSQVNLADGIYRADMRLTLDHSSRPMEKSFNFYVDQGHALVAEISDDLRAKLSRQSAGFVVTPSRITVAARPGGRRTEAAQLLNLTDEVLHVTVAAAEWYRTSSSKDLVAFEEPPHGHSGSSILSCVNRVIELAPKSRQRIPMVVEVPRGATGERYAALCFDRADIELDQSPEARARRSTMVRIRAEGTGEFAAETVSFDAKRNPKGAFDLTVLFRNTGNIGFTPEISFAIRDAEGGTVDKVRGPEQPPFVQAGGEGMVSREWTKVVEPGEYVAEATLRYDPDKPALTARAPFTVPAISAVAEAEEQIPEHE